ncbi:MAG: hypothetical protein WDN50_24550 [Bradyrhizobium sp.]
MHRSDRYAAFRSPVGRMIPLIAMGLIWQAVSATKLVDPAFLPSPLRIGHAMVDLLTGREIRDNLFVTLARAALGLALGSAVGVWLGLMMARSPKFRAYAAPIVGGTYSLPKSALIPLFILWFGIGTATTVCAVFLSCLLPMVVNTFQGVASTPRVLVCGGAGARRPAARDAVAGIFAACAARYFHRPAGRTRVLVCTGDLLGNDRLDQWHRKADLHVRRERCLRLHVRRDRVCRRGGFCNRSPVAGADSKMPALA